MSRALSIGTNLGLDLRAAAALVGGAAGPDGARPRYELPAHHFVTHGAVLGMTGSGKTGLVSVIAEEALRSRVPTLVIDIKGDLPNLLLAFGDLAPASFEPWVDAEGALRAGQSPAEAATRVAEDMRVGLARSGLTPNDVAAFRDSIAPRIITPGSTAAEPLHVLSSLERHAAAGAPGDVEAANDALGASISLVLRLVGRDGDPRSRDHVVLFAFAEARLRAGRTATVAELLHDVLEPPFPRIGALAYEDFLPPKEQRALAQDLNTLLASPKLASWLRGAPLDVAGWLTPKDGKTPLVIVSVAHLDDDERLLVLGLLLEEVLAYVRSLGGTSELRSLIVFDEVFGFLPPHPANPPTKKPLLALLKQARAFGVGVLLATQNPMDIDYKALSNAGLWFIGRLQTDADRERVVEGLMGADGGARELDPSALGQIIKSLPPRTFFVRDVHATPSASAVETRYAMSWLRGPMTRKEIAALARTLGPTEHTPPAVAPNIAAPNVAASNSASPMAPARGGTVAEKMATPAPPSPAAKEPPPMGAPTGPDGWRTFHGRGIAGAPCAYAPYAAMCARIRVRDTKLQLVREQLSTFVAPFGADGRVDLARAALVDPRNLEHPAVVGATYSPLPSTLQTKKGAKEIERALRDHAAVTYPVEIEANRELELCRSEGETSEAFHARVNETAQRRATALAQAAGAKLAPDIAKRQDKVASAERQLADAQRALSGAPSELGAAMIGLVAKGAGSDARKARSRAETSVEKATEALRKAQAALSAGVTEQRATMAAEHAEALRDAGSIAVERLTPKRGDTEVVWVGVAWSSVAR